MTREARTLLAVALLAVAGLAALGFMASRYSKMQPLKSVEEVAPEPPVIGSAPDESAPDEPADEPGGSVEADEPAPAAEEPAAAPDPIDAFIEVRKAVIAAIDADPGLKHRMLQELSGQAREAPSRVHYRILIDVKFARDDTCKRLGMPVEEYQRIRQSFIAWMGNEFVSKPADPALVVEFERRRAELEPLYLGLLETVDEGG